MHVETVVGVRYRIAYAAGENGFIIGKRLRIPPVVRNDSAVGSGDVTATPEVGRRKFERRGTRHNVRTAIAVNGRGVNQICG